MPTTAGPQFVPPALPWLTIGDAHAAAPQAQPVNNQKDQKCAGVPAFVLPVTGCLVGVPGHELPSATVLQALLDQAMASVQALGSLYPDVEGVDKMSRRIQCDQKFFTSMSTGVKRRATEQALDTAAAPSLPPPQLPLQRVQGVINNLRGFEGELMAARLCPGVVGVLRKFHSLPVNTGGSGTKVAGLLTVEVDVVARNGHCWVEVKNQEVFGLESVHWRGDGSHERGLQQQAQDLMAVAAAPCNARRWTAPKVVLFFPSGVHPDVRQELEGMGIHVADGADALPDLPPEPPMPSVVNLDVTAICALVSEVSYYHMSGNHTVPEIASHSTAAPCASDSRPDADAASTGPGETAAAATEPTPLTPMQLRLEAWSTKTIHWRECLAQQRSQPLLRCVAHCLPPSCTLVAARSAVAQFEVLLGQYSGPREQERWAQLQQHMRVYETVMPGTAAAADDPAAAAAAVAGSDAAGAQECAGSSHASGDRLPPNGSAVVITRRAAALAGVLEPLHVSVLGLSDALQAVTLTANRTALRCAERQGVALERVTHHAVWLTSM